MQSMVNLSSQLSQVRRDLDIAEDDFIGIFLYGSQNYGLSYEGSDTDSILIVRSASKSRKELLTSTGKVKLYTLDYFIYRLGQGDLRCYEILYTKYRVVNPAYIEHLEKFVENFSKCMSDDRIKHALHRKLDEHLNHVLWLMSTKDNSRYNKKRLYWAIRVASQLQRIDNGISFKDSLLHEDTLGYDLISIKTITNYLSIKDMSYIYRYLVKYSRSLDTQHIPVSDEEKSCFSELCNSLI